MTLPKLKKYGYNVFDIIGQGGAGIVYDAHDERSGYRVAIKALYTSRFKDDAMKQKFIEEANKYLYLEHENIVSLRDFLMTDSAYYLVMEYVEGKNMEQYISTDSGVIPEEKAIPMFTHILDAVAYAHHRGTIHLDIKPGNIMITETGKVKVLDFGISVDKNCGEKLDKVSGTPMYMSPEQVDNKNIDRRSDIYSLGVTLFQMVTGQLPYNNISNRATLFHRIKHEPLPRAASIYPLVSSGMQFIIDRATEKLPEKRFQTCEEFHYHLINLQNKASA